MTVVARTGRSHGANAACHNCEWDWLGSSTPAAVKSAARRHAEKTGHEVTVLTERATTFRKLTR